MFNPKCNQARDYPYAWLSLGEIIIIVKLTHNLKEGRKKLKTKSERNEKNEDSEREGIEGNGRAEM